MAPVLRRVTLVAAAVLAVAPAALADSATSAQVRALAGRAATDPAALAQLRRIDVVDGKRVALSHALAGARGRALAARLRVLASGGSAATPPRDASGEARKILAGRRYRGTSLPRPFHGVLQWLGRKLDFVRRAFDWLARRLPGGGWSVWAILGAIVVGAAAFVATRLARRRAAHAVAAMRTAATGGTDPRELERLADEAEQRGELELALRLRFRAGLLRLARARAIPPRPSLTSGEARRILRLAEFDRLARDFDEVVYGGREPQPDDVAAAKTAWPRVLEKAAAK
jgi:hypothetical protein